MQRQLEYAMKLRDAIDHHPLLSKYMHCLSTAELIPRAYPSLRHRSAAAHGSQQHGHGLGARRVRAGSVAGDRLSSGSPASTVRPSNASG